VSDVWFDRLAAATDAARDAGALRLRYFHAPG
jgi:hypothetical protein